MFDDTLPITREIALSRARFAVWRASLLRDTPARHARVLSQARMWRVVSTLV